MVKGANTKYFLPYRPASAPSHPSYDDGLNQRNYQGQNSMAGMDRRQETFGRYE